MRLLCVLRTQVILPYTKFCLAVTGSVKELGCWDRLRPAVGVYQGNGVWQVRVELPTDVNIEYKWILYEQRFGKIVDYEPGDNRKLRVEWTSLMVEDYLNGVQKIKEMGASEMAKLEHCVAVKTHINRQSASNFHLRVSESMDETFPLGGHGSETFPLAGHGSAIYDQYAVHLAESLNQGIYVPEEYKAWMAEYRELSNEDCSLIEGDTGNGRKTKGNPNLENQIFDHDDTSLLSYDSVKGEPVKAVFPEDEYSLLNQVRNCLLPDKNDDSTLDHTIHLKDVFPLCDNKECNTHPDDEKYRYIGAMVARYLYSQTARRVLCVGLSTGAAFFAICLYNELSTQEEEEYSIFG